MKCIDTLDRHKYIFIDCAILITIFVFILSYFQPASFWSLNIPTGGDMASHYYPAKYLKEVLLPKGRVVGWMQGNYAGFPLFQIYFPCPFLLIVLLSYVLPMQIAFKVISILGIFSLPFCVYFTLKLMHYKFPMPILGALFTLPFLFMEANSMWGGNIPSTLAGEFPFGIGFSLSILFLGTLHQGLASKKNVIVNGALLFFIGFNHAYTLLFSVLTSTFFLITTKDFVFKFKYLLKVYTLAFLLISFWAIPLVANIAYTTNFNIVWKMDSFFEVIPVMLIPFAAISVLGSIAQVIACMTKSWQTADKMSTPIPSLEDKKTGEIKEVVKKKRIFRCNSMDMRLAYLWFGIVISILFYFSANKIGVVDIRFLPFMQLLFVVIAAIGVYEGIKYLKLNWIVPILLTPLILLWAAEHVKYIPQWIAWNFTGFESKKFWPQLNAINQYLKGTENDPRVVYEHSPDHNAAGTPRAFESLPLFSGRSTLEGLYMQSTITSPFVFYIQSEISKVASAPFPDYSYTSLNLKEGIKHLKMFNVKDFIVISDTVKAAIKQFPEFELKTSYPPYEIYELKANDNHYVTPLAYEPVLCITKNWKRLFYEWFKDSRVNDVYLVVDKKYSKPDTPFRSIIRDDNLGKIQKIPIDTSGTYIKEFLKDDELLIETNWIDKPLLVKVSYHKNWRVEGADRIYQVSPCFMLIYPQSEHVRLYFGYGIADYIGRGLTLLGIIILGISAFSRDGWRSIFLVRSVMSGYNRIESRFYRTKFYEVVDKNKSKILIGVLSVILVFFLNVIFLQKKDPQKLYNNGLKYFDRVKYKDARNSFSKILNDFPFVSIADDANYYYAICFFKEDKFQMTIEAFQSLIDRYKDSNWVPEAYYHIGLCKTKLGDNPGARSAYQYLIDNYNATVWANYAKDRLKELH